MKKLFIVGMLLFAATAFAQIDEAKMERDLKVAESALQSLLGGNNNSTFHFGGRELQSNYIKGFGVIITTPANNLYFGNYTTRLTQVGSAGSNEVVVGKISTPSDGDQKDVEEQNKKNEEKIMEAFKIFLVDYASLIGQLKPDEKVVVKMKPQGHGSFMIARSITSGANFAEIGNEKESYSISGEISKLMLDDIRAGKLSREQALKTVKISRSERAEVPKDIEIMANIFNALYDVNTTETYWTSGQWNFEYAPEIGVIFDQRFYSSRPKNMNGKKIHDMPTAGKSDISQKARDEIVIDMYPKFLTDLKSNILDYGRTLKSLKSNEMFMIKATMTECEGCDIPETVEISLKAEVLSKYNSGELSKEKAASQIGVKEIGKQ